MENPVENIIVKESYRQLDEFKNRSNKLTDLQSMGINPYPHKYTPSHNTRQIQIEYSAEESSSEAAAEGKTPSISVAGRMMLFRAMGKNAFAQIQDHTGRIQLMFNRDLTEVSEYDPENSGLTQPPKPIKLIEKKFDLGDIIGIEGNIFRTKKGELTIFVKKATMLCKTLLPLPDKHCGLANKETRYRKRWLDLITNEDVCNTFRTRSKIIKTIRSYLEIDDFIEVETPVLQSIYGGAQARPFTTHFNSLDQDMFLRISLEIPLKKLIAGGMNKVFEISKVFRNEGLDKNHNPEFTLLEAYAAYWDYNDMMKFIEELFEKIAIELYGSTKVPFGEVGSDKYLEIDMKAPWSRITMKESIKKYGKIDIEKLSDDEIREILKIDEESACKLALKSRGELTAMLFEEKVEEHLIQPHHIIDHPIETTPLCKPHRNKKEREEGFVERFESFILGQEICNAYSELNDPIIQRELLVNQAKKLAAGDDEACPLDEEFLESVCQGMPPTAGIGIGIDRLVMLFTGSASIRDVLYFPFMKKE